MTNQEIKSKLEEILSLEDQTNYDSPESACESIADEFEDLTLEQHSDLCDMIEAWFESEK